ncbi:hypothetical protein RM530_14375 [Algiphilus sp. W345]|uniref:Uncharacterized protein n=1 Tax=Banduia mediterranea TaxID=3075609 RepID=A0ABU2WMS7_9GAMM|nr:hypothetical protein [Algiphilus sp. W345]MDT0498534.1 hypothetical protein [Algiphilus sp. W345]
MWIGGLRQGARPDPDLLDLDLLRIAMLLLIHLLAVFLAWVAGIIARRRGLQDQCRSNSDRKRQTLSDITLGWMVLAAKLLTLTQACFEQALRSLWSTPSCFNGPTTTRA